MSSAALFPSAAAPKRSVAQEFVSRCIHMFMSYLQDLQLF